MRKHESAGMWHGSLRGFTLVELLVVVAVIALLVGVLVPALSKARVASQSAVGMSNVRQLALAQSSYASRSDDWIAGPNTSGVSGIIDSGKGYEYSTSSGTPTTTHDWISPCLGDEMGYSPNRAERTFQIFSRFRCPRAGESSQLFGSATDMADFEKVEQTKGGYGQVSYLAPSPFMYAGPKSKNGTKEAGWAPRQMLTAFPTGKTAYTKTLTSFPDPFAPPANYRPQMSTIKNASAKVCVADGTRYVAIGTSFGRTALLDFDVNPAPSIYGSFTESPPSYDDNAGSIAYGRKYGTSIREVNVDFSMRFPVRQMHVGFFDGHSERINSTRAWSDPTLWYPSGSEYTGKKSTPEIQDAWKAGDLVP